MSRKRNEDAVILSWDRNRMKKDAPYLAALCLSAGLFLSPALLTSRVLLPGDLLTNHLPWGYMVEGVSPNNVSR